MSRARGAGRSWKGGWIRADSADWPSVPCSYGLQPIRLPLKGRAMEKKMAGCCGRIGSGLIATRDVDD